MITIPGPLIDRQPASLDDLRKIAAARQLYAVLDACDAPTVLAKVMALGADRALSLYRGSAEEEYYDIAPYLVRVDADLLAWIRETLWKEPWGIFLVTQADLDALHKHLRKFLLVQSPEEEQWYFRYYDPRVLEKFYKTCVAEQLYQLYGPVRAYGVTDVERGDITLLWMKAGEGGGSPPPPPTKGPLLRIRPEQLAAFQPEAEKDFVNRLVQHVKERFAEKVEGLTDDVLRERVRSGLARGRRYGITAEAPLAAFVSLLFAFAPDFDEHPRMQQVLRNENIPPNDRMDELVEVASDQDWEEVKQRSNPNAWGPSR